MMLNGDLKWIEAGGGKILALSKSEEVFCRIGVDDRNPGGKSWKHIPFDGKIRQVINQSIERSIERYTFFFIRTSFFFNGFMFLFWRPNEAFNVLRAFLISNTIH